MRGLHRKDSKIKEIAKSAISFYIFCTKNLFKICKGSLLTCRFSGCKIKEKTQQERKNGKKKNALNRFYRERQL